MLKIKRVKIYLNNNKNNKNKKLVLSNLLRANQEKENKIKHISKNHNYVSQKKRIKVKLEIIFFILTILLLLLLKKMDLLISITSTLCSKMS